MAGPGLIKPTGRLPIGMLANQTITTMKIVFLYGRLASGLMTLATEDHSLIFVLLISENVKIL